MGLKYRFDRMEIAGALGDLGTLLPLAMGLILVNGLAPAGIFFSIGIFYVLSGCYFRVPTAVQPMKVISAYAIATAMTPHQILASGLLMGGILLVIGVTDAISAIGKYIPEPVVRGVQLSTGIVLMSKGLRFIIGTSGFQALQATPEPYLAVQHIGPFPLGVVIGVGGGILTLLFLNSRKLPAGLLIIVTGAVIGLAVGTHEGFERLKIGIYWPTWFPFGLPSKVDFTFALFALALPQLPMTIGNAVIANADLSSAYFKADSVRVTYRALTLSMAAANILCFIMGGMPLCHGAGGLAAHYRFGARTAGSNWIIGLAFAGLALLFGPHALAVIHLIPMAVLGVLLTFAGSQLALSILDINERNDLFVTLLILGVTLVSNLAAGFFLGIAVTYFMRWRRCSI